jgi:hypothetical protein
MKASVTIRFTSGRQERFEVELWGGPGAQARLRAFLEKPTLLLQTSDEVLIIPGSAIECISIKINKRDSPFNLPDIRPATRIK